MEGTSHDRHRSDTGFRGGLHPPRLPVLLPAAPGTAPAPGAVHRDHIWQDPAAAAAVRAVADGNETVPTVHVAGQWLVNPRAARVAQLARR
jgi:hypothetical protein